MALLCSVYAITSDCFPCLWLTIDWDKAISFHWSALDPRSLVNFSDENHFFHWMDRLRISLTWFSNWMSDIYLHWHKHSSNESLSAPSALSGRWRQDQTRRVIFLWVWNEWISKRCKTWEFSCKCVAGSKKYRMIQLLRETICKNIHLHGWRIRLMTNARCLLVLKINSKLLGYALTNSSRYSWWKSTRNSSIFTRRFIWKRSYPVLLSSGILILDRWDSRVESMTLPSLSSRISDSYRFGTLGF